MSYTYTGALHIHTDYSDGTANIKEIAVAAKKAGLSWIIITDHNNLLGLHNNEEGWYDGVAVMIGAEISPPSSDHYLAFNINKDIINKIQPAAFMQEVRSQGGFGFIAHPDENVNRKNRYKPLRWTDWNIEGFDGIEIWNHLSDWVDNYDSEKIVHCYFNRNEILSGPSTKLLQWWDSLNNTSPTIVPAIAGSDAHALSYKFLGLTFKVFPYYDTFKAVANCLYLDEKLSNDFNTAKRQIYSALLGGRNTIINRFWNKGKGDFSFFVENKDESAFPGSLITLNRENSSKIVIKVPRKGNIRLIHNGCLIQEYLGKELIYDNIERGKYRVEVFYKKHPWIFTNPIQVVTVD